MLKRAERKVLYAIAGLFILVGMGVPTQAAETGNASAMTLQQTVKDTEMKEEPDSNADTLAELPEGAAVIVYGEPQDSWSQIQYDGANGYIESSALESYMTEDEAAELDQEFETVQEENMRAVDEYELVQKSKRKSIIWGAVIAILIVGIFAVGIVSALKKDKEGNQE